MFPLVFGVEMVGECHRETKRELELEKRCEILN